jgi:gamma-glutamyltranspeptidase / glutathione hydrolase
VIPGRRVFPAAGPILLILAGVRLVAQQPSPTVRGEVRASHGVASIFAASVVEISHFGLGREAPIIIYSARDQRVIVVNDQGSGPERAIVAW